MRQEARNPGCLGRNVVKCPQCREPIDLQENDSAECAVKLGQFLNENLAGGAGPSSKVGPAGHPPVAGPPGSVDVVWSYVKALVRRHSLVMAIGGMAALLVVLDTLWFHTGTVTLGALMGGVIAVAAWKSEVTRHVPSAARRAELEYKVAIGLVVLLGLRLAWFCRVETSAIVDAKDLASVAPVLELLPKWGAILAVILLAMVVLGAALASLALVQRFSIYHVLSGGLVLLSLGYGVADVVAWQMVGIGVRQFARQQLEPPPPVEVVSPAKPAVTATGTATATKGAAPDGAGRQCNGQEWSRHGRSTGRD